MLCVKVVIITPAAQLRTRDVYSVLRIDVSHLAPLFPQSRRSLRREARTTSTRDEEEDTENRRGRDHVVDDDEFNDEKTDEETGFESTDDPGGV